MSELVYKVSKLDGTGVENVHAARLRLYKTSLEGAPVPKELMDLAERTEARYELIKRIVDNGEDKDSIHLQVQWRGLPDRRDWTWIPLTTLHEDAPDLLTTFMDSTKSKKRLVAKATSRLLNH